MKKSQNLERQSLYVIIWKTVGLLLFRVRYASLLNKFII